MIRDPSDGTTKKRPSVSALKARHGDTWGINPPPDMLAKPRVQSMTAGQLKDHYAIYNLAFEPKPRQEDQT